MNTIIIKCNFFYKTDLEIAEIPLNDAMVNRQGFLSEFILQIPTYQFDTSDLGVFIHFVYGTYTVKLRWQTDLCM